MKRKRLIGVSVFILFALLVFNIYKHRISTPYDALRNQKQYGANECLLEVNLNDNEYIVFYMADNGISVAVMKKGFFNYNIRYISTIPFSNIKNYSIRFGTFRENKWIFWGVLDDPSIKEIKVEGVSANILNTAYPFSICYLIGDGTPHDVPEYEIVY